MRVVLDTYVLASATLIRGGKEDRILRAWRRGAFDLVFSLTMLQEVSRVLTHEKLWKHRWLTDAEVVELLAALASQRVMVPGTAVVTASRDPEDDKFWAAGLEGGSKYVVAGDKDPLA